LNITDRNFILNNVVALFYNAVSGFLIFNNKQQLYLYSAILALTAGLHLIFLITSALTKMLKFKIIGNVGYTIISVLMVNIIFWLLLSPIF
jgi:hypothetical protein